MSDRTGIVIPCYNEAKRLPVERFEAFLNEHHKVTYCFVNDGSSDDTLAILSRLEQKFGSQVVLLDNKENLGKAESVRKGMNHLLYEGDNLELIGFLDADLSTSLDQFYSLCIYLKDHSLNAVFGSRIKRMGSIIQRSTPRHYIGRVIATLIGSITGLPIYDSQCGAKVFAASSLKEILADQFQTKWLFDVELILRLKKKLGSSSISKKVHEFPLEQWLEVGDSKITTTELVRIPLELFKVYRISLKE
jgi:glycosyltransferase involved in cell wall biosynthesis